eukprot:2038565-Karenia_brevis.AAC.1
MVQALFAIAAARAGLAGQSAVAVSATSAVVGIFNWLHEFVLALRATFGSYPVGGAPAAALKTCEEFASG